MTMEANKWNSVKDGFPDLNVKILIMYRLAREYGNTREFTTGRLTNDGFRDIAGKPINGEVVKWAYIS